MPHLPVHKEVPEKQIESDYLRSVWACLPIFYTKIRQFSEGGKCHRHSEYLQSLAPAVPGPLQQPKKPLTGSSDHRKFLQTHNCMLMTAEWAFGRGKGRRQVERGDADEQDFNWNSIFYPAHHLQEGGNITDMLQTHQIAQAIPTPEWQIHWACCQAALLNLASWGKGTSISTPRFVSRLEPLTPVQKLILSARLWWALRQGFYTLLCWFCMPCLPLLNRMEGCKFTIGDMSVFAQHALYTFINFVLNGGCDFTPEGNQE